MAIMAPKIAAHLRRKQHYTAASTSNGYYFAFHRFAVDWIATGIQIRRPMLEGSFCTGWMPA
jgi:uncharacterized membrane protein (DUF485 family)